MADNRFEGIYCDKTSVPRPAHGKKASLRNYDTDVDGKGAALTDVTDDVDGESRGADNDVGADQCK